MKNKILYPFALTALMAALTGCGGGESANIQPEPDEEATTNGSCNSNSSNCLEWGLEYPLDGLNFKCSSDKENQFISLFDLNNAVATGTCNKNDEITFSIQSYSNTAIDLGKLKLSQFATLNSQNQLPRLSVLDIASGITGRTANNLVETDSTVRVAMNLVKVLQALALQENNIVDPTDVQPLYITDDMRKALGKISSNIKLTDSDFETKVKSFADTSKISDAQALETVKKLVTIANAAVYQPEFSLFSTAGIGGSTLSGSNGLVGCNKATCDVLDRGAKHLFGHFMLITDRQGYTFGSGIQWRDSNLKLASSNLTSLGGLNAELIRSVKPVQMTADPQTSWIHPVQKRLTAPYQLKVADTSSPLEIYQGKLLNDYVIAGTKPFYQLVTTGEIDDKKELTEQDRLNLGKWRLAADSENYNGSIDLYKIYPISYLDGKVFKTVKNVASRENYVFPMYANLKFSFNDTSISPVTLGIVIDSNGDIRTNMQSNTDLSTHPTLGCSGDALAANMVDANAVQQYRLGTLGRAFVKENTVSMRMVLANPKFGNINGALVGVDSKIQTSTNANDTIVIGGALLHLNNVLTSSAGQQGRVSFLNSAGESVKWANTYASFQNIYNTANKDAADVDLELAKLNGGAVEFKLADCYRVQAK